MKVNNNALEITLSPKEYDYYSYIFTRVASDEGNLKVFALVNQ